jgi:hypothetical protein
MPRIILNRLSPALFPKRINIVWFVFLFKSLSVFASGIADLNFESDIRPLLDQYCFRCHGEEKQKGDIQLSSFHDKRGLLKEYKLWQEVIHQIKSEEMPEEEPLPTHEERTLLVSWLEQTLNEIDWSKVKNPGHITMPRLTKEEYNNTMRDLLGIDIKPGNFFSEDGEGHSGFTNDRDSLVITPVLMEKYFAAAERSIDALLSYRYTPVEFFYESEDMFMTETRETPKQFEGDFFGYVINRGQMTLYESIDFPYDGIYEFRIRALSTGGPTGTRLRINDEIKGDIEVHEETAGIYSLNAFVPEGTQQVAWNIEVPEVYFKAPKIEGGDNPHRPQSIAIDWIEVRGPALPEAIQVNPLVFIAKPGKGMSAEKAANRILTQFLPRAFRRPVSKREADRYRELFEREMQAGQSFEDSIKLSLTAILVSPHFLYRPELEPAPQNEPYKIDDFQLASRLSYFLWATMPDEELFKLAKAKRLSRPGVLKRQIDRMLNDSRAHSTMETFLGQWLGYDALGKTVFPDQRKFGEFTPVLNRAMKEETFLAFMATFQEGGSLLDLLDSDKTYLNEVLAKHYGIEGVVGNDMRLVKLDEPYRGGLLGMGSVLTATSNPIRTNPVSRGKWVLETLLGNRIPEPPADAGILPETAGQIKGQTLREEFEMHRRNPSCVDCHEKIDPIGFGLENFDAIGRFRTEENGVRLDSSGVMPDGTVFEGPAELKAYIIKERKDLFIRTVTEKLLAYGLGRDLKHYDEGAIIKIIDALEKSGYNTKTLISEIVLSYPFQNQHPNPDDE